MKKLTQPTAQMFRGMPSFEDGSAGETVAAMRRVQVLDRAERHDACGIDVIVSDVVVALDVIEIDGVGNSVLLVEMFEVAEQMWVIGDAAEIALEMAVINRVEADECHEQAPIAFDDLCPAQKTLSAQPGVELIEGV